MFLHYDTFLPAHRFLFIWYFCIIWNKCPTKFAPGTLLLWVDKYKYQLVSKLHPVLQLPVISIKKGLRVRVSFDDPRLRPDRSPVTYRCFCLSSCDGALTWRNFLLRGYKRDEIQFRKHGSWCVCTVWKNIQVYCVWGTLSLYKHAHAHTWL